MPLSEYKVESFYDEMFSDTGETRDTYLPLVKRLNFLGDHEIFRRRDSADRALLSLGMTFRVYTEEIPEERILPFDIIPRIIPSSEWESIEKGLRQRSIALNRFIQDLYNGAEILKDGIVPEELIKSSSDYLPEMEGFTPPKGIWIHISGTDLIRNDSGDFYVLEDNLRCPSGVSYVLENREVMKRTLPELFERLPVRAISDYCIRLKQSLEFLSEDNNPTIALLTPGIYNSAYYEHSFLAQKMGVNLVEGSDLIVKDSKVFMRTTKGLKRVDVIYKRIDDRFIDPDVFLKDSLLGVRGLFQAYQKGNVALANAPGTGVADDKVIYAYTPEIIRYYLNEEPIIPIVPTYLCSRREDQEYVLEHLQDLVVKRANGAGGYGMLIGPASTATERNEFRKRIIEHPREYIAQPTFSLSRVPTVVGDSFEGRHVDLRPFSLYGPNLYVMPGGLTRVALKKGSLVVNSSQGGGSKDTWVLG